MYYKNTSQWVPMTKCSARWQWLYSDIYQPQEGEGASTRVALAIDTTRKPLASILLRPHCNVKLLVEGKHLHIIDTDTYKVQQTMNVFTGK